MNVCPCGRRIRLFQGRDVRAVCFLCEEKVRIRARKRERRAQRKSDLEARVVESTANKELVLERDERAEMQFEMFSFSCVLTSTALYFAHSQALRDLDQGSCQFPAVHRVVIRSSC